MSGPTPQQVHREGVALNSSGRVPRCALKDGRWGECGGELQADHVIEQQRLKTLYRLATKSKRVKAHADPPHFARLRELPGVGELLADADNGWLLCERHHNLKTRRLLRPWLRRSDLPPSVEGFAERYGLVGILDREFEQ